MRKAVPAQVVSFVLALVSTAAWAQDTGEGLPLSAAVPVAQESNTAVPTEHSLVTGSNHIQNWTTDDIGVTLVGGNIVGFYYTSCPLLEDKKTKQLSRSDKPCVHETTSLQDAQKVGGHVLHELVDADNGSKIIGATLEADPSFDPRKGGSVTLTLVKSVEALHLSVHPPNSWAAISLTVTKGANGLEVLFNGHTLSQVNSNLTRAHIDYTCGYSDTHTTENCPFPVTKKAPNSIRVAGSQ